MGMNDLEDSGADKRDPERLGLPMVSAWDPEALEQEKQELAALNEKPFLQRMKGYFAKVGPGWLQSAMTLGGGSAGASLFAGAFLGYGLLWLQPIAMLLGIIMLSAVAYQTLTTNVRPFDAMRTHVHPLVAWAWALASFAATIIWSFPQYGLASGMARDIIKAVSGSFMNAPLEVNPWIIGGLVLFACTWITWNYGSGTKGIKVYEKVIKTMVWLIVIAFATVVIRQTVKGNIDWGAVARGYIPFTVPSEEQPLGAIDEGFGLTILQEDSGFKKLAVDREYISEDDFNYCEKLVPGLRNMGIDTLGPKPDALEKLAASGLADDETDAETLYAAIDAVAGTLEAPSPEATPYDRYAMKMADASAVAVAAGAMTQEQATELLEIQNDAVAQLNDCRAVAEGDNENGETLRELMVQQGYVEQDRADKIVQSLKGDSAQVIMAGFGAAVGINMTFLFGYTLLARGWGKGHRGLAGFDLFSGMLVPYAIAVSLMIIATASTIYPSIEKLGPIEAAKVLEPTLGLFFGRVLFGLGILGMVLSSITLLMLVNAFTLCELVGWQPTGWRYKVAALTPAVGVFGVAYWDQLKIWIAIPTSAVCGVLLPIAYISFFILNNKKSFLGKYKPTGLKAGIWNLAMLAAIGASIASSSYGIYTNWDNIVAYGERLVGLFTG